MTPTPRTIARRASAITLALALFIAQACGAQSLAANADRVANTLDEATPIFKTLIAGGIIQPDQGPRILDRLAEGSQAARELAAEFRAGNNADAVNTTARVINLVETIINQDTQLIRDPARRTAVLAVLAAADLALHIIADNMIKIARDYAIIGSLLTAWAPQKTKAAAEVIKTYASRPRLRCRDAKTGKFLKMEQCKARPESTVIETVKP